MSKSISKIRPFLASISYLVEEARRQKMPTVSRICLEAEKELSRHMLDSVFSDQGRKAKLSKHDYEFMSGILVKINRMPEDKLMYFMKFVDHECEELQN